MANSWGNNGNSEWLYFGGAPKSLQVVIAAIKLNDTWSLEKKSYYQPRQHIKKQRHYFVDKSLSSQSYAFSSSHVWMWELNYKERWELKNWCFLTVLRVSWSARRSNQSILKDISLEYSLEGRTDAEVETPIHWSPDAKNWLLGKDPDVGRRQKEKGKTEAWKQEEKWKTEARIVGWHHRLDGPEFNQALGVDDGQGGLVCCSSWGRKHGVHGVGHNWATELNWFSTFHTYIKDTSYKWWLAEERSLYLLDTFTWNLASFICC